MTREEPQTTGRGARNGRIRQSLALWCLEDTEWGWDLERTCSLARDLGCPSVELVPPESWTTLREQGLVCALAANGMPDPPFARGLNNPANHEEVIARTHETIDRCAEFGFPNVIAFTGYKWREATDPTSEEIPLAEGADRCVEGLRTLARRAEARGVTVCLEQLNTRDDTQEINLPAVMKALLDVGYTGYVGQEFIPTRDPERGLAEAVALCDV